MSECDFTTHIVTSDRHVKNSKFGQGERDRQTEKGRRLPQREELSLNECHEWGLSQVALGYRRTVHQICFFFYSLREQRTDTKFESSSSLASASHKHTRWHCKVFGGGVGRGGGEEGIVIWKA